MSSAEQDMDNEQDLAMAKGIAMVVLGVTSLLLGLLPLKLATWLGWRRGNGESLPQMLSLLLLFGGGALLCTTFMHLLPEVREQIEEFQEVGFLADTGSIHLAELIMCSGFFIMFLIEECVHAYMHLRQRKRGSSVISRSFSIRRDSCAPVSNDTKSLSTVTLDETTSHVIHNHLPMTESDSVTASLRGLLIVLALSIHELFEGLAVGLEKKTSLVWYMLGAVAAHKLVISFTVGTELVASQCKTRLAIIYIATFALVSPLGIGVGLGLTMNAQGQDSSGVVNAVLQGLATGTLLYVVFFEVLHRGRAEQHGAFSGLYQAAAIMAGYGLMLGMLSIAQPHMPGILRPPEINFNSPVSR